MNRDNLVGALVIIALIVFWIWFNFKKTKFIAAAKSEGYKEGAKDGEGTKNGVKRYQMGFDAGKAEGGKEMLEKITDGIEKIETADVDIRAIDFISGQQNIKTRVEQFLLSLSENKPK